MKILLNDCIKISTNKIYESRHWYYRSSMKDKFKKWFDNLDTSAIPEYENKIKLNITFIFKRNPLDCSNCSYMGKMIEDLLKYKGKIKDDSIKYIEEVTYKSIKDKDQKEDVNVILEITETEKQDIVDVTKTKRLCSRRTSKQEGVLPAKRTK